jgi:hypothetical protein
MTTTEETGEELGPVETELRRRRRRPQAETRRLGSAGRAFCLVVAALAVAALLDARSLHKSVVNEPPGWKRTVLLRPTTWLAATSSHLYLDRPRGWVESALGRPHEDEIDATVAVPVQAKPVVVRRRAFSPSHPLRLWVAGDSLVVAPGYALVRATGPGRAVTTVGGVDGRLATGLDRPDVFNWFLEIRRQLRVLKPDAVVLSFGANDDKSYLTGAPAGTRISEFDDPAWQREYARRVRGLVDLINRAGAYVVWIGLPVTRDPAQTARFDQINAVVYRVLRSRPSGSAFVDSYRLFTGPDGGYTEYMPTSTGGTIDVRAADGVHLSPAGGDILARQVLGALNRKFDLTSWRRAGGTAAGT